MLVQVAGFILNGFLSYGFIFGRFGCPAWGAPGAAVATAGAQGIVFAALAMIFLRPAHRERHWTWRARFFERDLFGRLIRFGLPEGLRFVVEMVAFTVFLFIVGRVGETELAATNIVWRLNGFAFFPLIGLARAIAVLVGHAQGLSRPELAARATYRGVLISEAWMLFTAAVFLLAPRQLMAIFNNDAGVAPQETEQIVALGVVLLRFVALYCVLDGLNVIFLGALQGAGDTRWTFAAACGIYTIFLGMLVAMDHYHASLYQLWGVMTFFVMAQALIWFARFRVGRWRTMRVIEPSVAENSDGNT
jgi:MATE family multidrug resistance protein